MNEVSVQWIDGNSFATTTGSGHTLVLDSKPKEGEMSAGPSPMEMLLVGVAGCTAIDVVHILGRQRQPMTGLTVNVHGERTSDYPMVYTNITIEYIVHGEIAIVTDDGKNVSAHFGKAKYYFIATLLDSGTLSTEMLARNQGDHHHDYDHEHHHGHGGGGHAKFQPILDCDLLAARGMGSSAVDYARSQGINVILTDIKVIDDVLAGIADGSIEHNPARVHHVNH